MDSLKLLLWLAGVILPAWYVVEKTKRLQPRTAGAICVVAYLAGSFLFLGTLVVGNELFSTVWLVGCIAPPLILAKKVSDSDRKRFRLHAASGIWMLAYVLGTFLTINAFVVS